tara:strand:- start:237067 stop:237369 length:303 start_codon:yes stop_codon:yes gene_type:complete
MNLFCLQVMVLVFVFVFHIVFVMGTELFSLKVHLREGRVGVKLSDAENWSEPGRSWFRLVRTMSQAGLSLSKHGTAQAAVVGRAHSDIALKQGVFIVNHG